jgi:glutamine synthetase
MICAEYIWLDSDDELRSKTRILTTKVLEVNELPIWNYDGSSTGQATLSDSEVYIKPKAIFLDPLRKNNNILVLCDTYNSDTITPHKDNKRVLADSIFKRTLRSDFSHPLFGIEQEYFLINNNVNNKSVIHNKKHYCGINNNLVFREIVEKHLQACLYANISITGINSEVSTGQFEFQICDEGIKASDHLYIARYLLIRIAESYNIEVSFEAKPFPNENGSGCHVNFSTLSMRNKENGIKYIKDAIDKLSICHDKHISMYGLGIEKRLIGTHETSSIDKFSYGVGDRSVSIRIPKTTNIDGCGYFEDRRPCANINPYVVTSLIFYSISSYI